MFIGSSRETLKKNCRNSERMQDVERKSTLAEAVKNLKKIEDKQDFVEICQV